MDSSIYSRVDVDTRAGILPECSQFIARPALVSWLTRRSPLPVAILYHPLWDTRDLDQQVPPRDSDVIGRTSLPEGATGGISCIQVRVPMIHRHRFVCCNFDIQSTVCGILRSLELVKPSGPRYYTRFPPKDQTRFSLKAGQIWLSDISTEKDEIDREQDKMGDRLPQPGNGKHLGIIHDQRIAAAGLA